MDDESLTSEMLACFRVAASKDITRAQKHIQVVDDVTRMNGGVYLYANISASHFTICSLSITEQARKTPERRDFVQGDEISKPKLTFSLPLLT